MKALVPGAKGFSGSHLGRLPWARLSLQDMTGHYRRLKFTMEETLPKTVEWFEKNGYVKTIREVLP